MSAAVAGRVSRLVRCATGLPRPRDVAMLDLPLGAALASRVEGCSPWRLGASRTMELGEPDVTLPGELLCCVPTPPAVMCVGLNYRKHAAEAGLPEPKYPVVFYKNPAAVCGPGDEIVIPSVASEPAEVDYECELAVVI
eukprot:SAG11_NODE_11745_length_740_cov_1.276131_2_plen_138_part_01